jgi:hypothetical protein
MTDNLIPFLGRQYYRLATGAGTVGLPVTVIMLVFNTYGIWKESLQYYDIPLVPFAIAGSLGLAVLYWAGAFVLEQTGIYRSVQSHANKEVNQELAEACERIKKIAEKMNV